MVYYRWFTGEGLNCSLTLKYTIFIDIKNILNLKKIIGQDSLEESQKKKKILSKKKC